MKFVSAAAALTGLAGTAIADPLYRLYPAPVQQVSSAVAAPGLAVATHVVPTIVSQNAAPDSSVYRAPNQVIGEGIEKARADGVSQQYHSQDEVGNYAYGYVNENSEKHEASDARSGMVKGHYVYVDGHGLNRRVDYVADNQGFHQKSIRPLVL